MAYTEAHKRAVAKYRKTHVKRVAIDFQISEYDAIREHAQARGETTNGFIRRSIWETMQRDKEE